jgi:hypothetical protein
MVKYRLHYTTGQSEIKEFKSDAEAYHYFYMEGDHLIEYSKLLRKEEVNDMGTKQ